jgi:hypothetical protein
LKNKMLHYILRFNCPSNCCFMLLRGLIRPMSVLIYRYLEKKSEFSTI